MTGFIRSMQLFEDLKRELRRPEALTWRRSTDTSVRSQESAPVCPPEPRFSANIEITSDCFFTRACSMALNNEAQFSLFALVERAAD
jgi:hypothetical protein